MTLLYRGLNFRPTNRDVNKFLSEMHELKNTIINKTKTKFEEVYDIFDQMDYNKYLQNWTNAFTNHVNEYIKDAIDTLIRNPNVSDNELNYLIKRFSRNYDWIALQSDKNNGIVFVNKNWLLDFNEKHLLNQKQFTLIYKNINKSTNKINEIINNAKLNTDSNKIFELIYDPKFNLRKNK